MNLDSNKTLYTNNLANLKIKVKQRISDHTRHSSNKLPEYYILPVK